MSNDILGPGKAEHCSVNSNLFEEKPYKASGPRTVDQREMIKSATGKRDQSMLNEQ